MVWGSVIWGFERKEQEIYMDSCYLFGSITVRRESRENFGMMCFVQIIQSSGVESRVSEDNVSHLRFLA